MKRVTFVALVTFFAALPLLAVSQNNNVKQVKNAGGEQLYKVATTRISIGNMAYSQKVLHAWKDFDNNTLDNSASMFADTVVATFADGTVVKGKENLLKNVKDFRSNLAAVTSTVNAITTLKSPDEPEHEVVSIWGMETDTLKDGTIKKTHLNEVWFFNKEGKVARIHQLAAKDAPSN